MTKYYSVLFCEIERDFNARNRNLFRRRNDCKFPGWHFCPSHHFPCLLCSWDLQQECETYPISYFHISKYCFERVEFSAKTIFVFPKTANVIIPYMKIQECSLMEVFAYLYFPEICSIQNSTHIVCFSPLGPILNSKIVIYWMKIGKNWTMQCASLNTPFWALLEPLGTFRNL